MTPAIQSKLLDAQAKVPADDKAAMTSTFSHDDLEVLRNRTFDEIAVGDSACI